MCKISITVDIGIDEVPEQRAISLQGRFTVSLWISCDIIAEALTDI